MAQSKNQQSFTELEYVFRKYYNENIASVVSKEQRDLRAKQEEETRHRSSGLEGYVDAANPFASMAYSKGKWNNKTSDDLVKSISSRIGKDTNIIHDLQIMTASWKAVALRELGKEKYDKLSKQVGGDLAAVFVNNRFGGMMIDQLAKSKVPHSSLEYILRRGFGNTLVGMAVNGKQSQLDNDLETLAMKLYKPKSGTKGASRLLTATVDGVSLGVAGLKSFATTVIADVAMQGVVSCVNTDGKTFDQFVSEAMYGDKSVIQSQRQGTKKVNPSRSETIDVVNGVLSNKMKVPSYRQPFSPTRMNQMCRQFVAATNDGLKHIDHVRSINKEFGIKVNTSATVPQWMSEKSKTECIRMSSYYLAMAVEMKNSHSSKVSIKGRDKTVTYADACQLSYDYARAAATKQKAEDREVERLREEEEAAAVKSQNSVTASATYSSPMQVQQTSQGIDSQEQRTAAVSGWSGLMNTLGLSGFGDIGHNLGYVLGMLPDMLVGMFTGTTSSLKLKDNIFPLATIFAGMFIKNPILKMMLISLGGANLLNKVGHEAIERSEASNQSVRYREYPNEILDSRIVNPAMKGYSLVATIDGIPSSIIIDERTADAYYKGKIPLNTLCNAVLRKYDEQYEVMNTNLAHQLDETEERHVSRGLR